MRAATLWIALATISTTSGLLLSQDVRLEDAASDRPSTDVETAFPLPSLHPGPRHPHGYLWEGFDAPIEYDIYGDRCRHRIQPERYGNRFGRGGPMMAPEFHGSHHPVDGPIQHLESHESTPATPVRLPAPRPESLPSIPTVRIPSVTTDEFEPNVEEAPGLLVLPENSLPDQELPPVVTESPTIAPAPPSGRESPVDNNRLTTPNFTHTPSDQKVDLRSPQDPPVPALRLKPSELVEPSIDLPADRPIRVRSEDLPANELPVLEPVESPRTNRKTLEAVRALIKT